MEQNMKYEVTIEARVVKSYIIEADDENAAIEQAHETFSVLHDGTDEHYEQELLGICGVKA
jgi:hypothetical protein